MSRGGRLNFTRRIALRTALSSDRLPLLLRTRSARARPLGDIENWIVTVPLCALFRGNFRCIDFQIDALKRLICPGLADRFFCGLPLVVVELVDRWPARFGRGCGRGCGGTALGGGLTLAGLEIIASGLTGSMGLGLTLLGLVSSFTSGFGCGKFFLFGFLISAGVLAAAC